MNKLNKRRKDKVLKTINALKRRRKNNKLRLFNKEAFCLSRCKWLERYMEILFLILRGVVEGDLSMRRPRKPYRFIAIKRILRPEYPGHFLNYWAHIPVRVDVNNIPTKYVTHQQLINEGIGIINLVNNPKTTTWASDQGGYSYLYLMESHMVCLKNNGKRDIIVELANPIDPNDVIVAFSEKTFIFGTPTLVRGGDMTLFRYKIKGTKEVIDKIRANIHRINNLKEGDKNLIKQRLISIEELGGVLEFHSVDYEQLEKRLYITDTSFIEILAHMLNLYYSAKCTSSYELVDQTILDNPLSLSRTDRYKTAYSDFLLRQAIGKEINEIIDCDDLEVGLQKWKHDASRYKKIIKVIGLIALNDDYNMFTYNLYDREHFIEFLLRHTMFDTPSSQKINYANILDINDELYIDLCLHVRFDKPEKIKQPLSENDQYKKFQQLLFTIK